jgi:hypothetical protein
MSTKSGDQPQEDLVGLTTRQIEEKKNLGILLHVGKLLEPIGKYGD